MVSFSNSKKLLILVLTINLIIASLIAISTDNFSAITGFAVSGIEDSRVYILNAYQGKDVTFLIPIDNDEKEIEEIYAELKILDLSGNEVANLETNSISISPNESNELRAIWFGSGFDEKYEVRIMVFDDEKTYSFSKIFDLEKEIITFESVVIQEFSLGEIANLSAILRNHLNEEIKDVSVSILILDEEGNTISEIISDKKDIQENSLAELEIIWDTKGVARGRYNAQMIINYNERFIDRDLIINIQQDVFDIVGVGYSIIGNVEESPRNQTLIYFLVILLLIVNIIWLFYHLKSKRNNKIRA